VGWHLKKLRPISKMQKFFLIMVMLVCGLLFYANGVAFELISAPVFAIDIIGYAVLAVAVALAIFTLSIVIRDKRRGLFYRTNSSNVFDSVKESNEIPCTIPLEMAAQEPVKISSKTPLPILFPVNTSNRTDRVEAEADKIEQEKQPTKQLIKQTTTLICPACRKKFDLPIYLGDPMVDFGPPKPSDLVRPCIHCGEFIALKRRAAEEEDIWRE
jgi:hypothetical protein